jgi:plasmid stabilization system protein ParE
MRYAIIWSPKAITTFEDRIDYLKTHFTEKEIKKFRKRVSEYLDTLSQEPLIARKLTRIKNVHIGLVIKPVSLIYRIKPIKQELELVAFIDNRQSPKKTLKYML